jgi:hypothetical protein
MSECLYYQQLMSPLVAEAEASSFALDPARRRRRVRERLQKIMADLARERRDRPHAGG